MDNTEQEAVQEQPKGPSLLIELLPDGTISVHGPLQNRLLVYGMLEAARDVVQNYVARAEGTPAPQPPKLTVVRDADLASVGEHLQRELGRRP